MQEQNQYTYVRQQSLFHVQITSVYELKILKNQTFTEYPLDTFYFQYMHHAFFIFSNSMYLKIYMRRLFTVHPSCQFSILYLKLILKSNTSALSGTVSLLAGLEPHFWFSLCFVKHLYKEKILSQEGLESGCVLSAKVWHKWIEQQKKEDPFLLVSKLIAVLRAKCNN